MTLTRVGAHFTGLEAEAPFEIKKNESIPKRGSEQMPFLSVMSTPANLPAMLAIIVVSWLSFDTPAIADVKIVVTYTDVQHEVSPNVADWKSTRTRTWVLTSDHKIKSEVDYGWGHQTASNIIEFGKSQSATNFTGATFVTRYTVENGAIVKTSITTSYSQIIRITTNGVDACSATVNYKLLRGHKLFTDKRMSNHEDMQISDWRVEDVSCAISSVNN